MKHGIVFFLLFSSTIFVSCLKVENHPITPSIQVLSVGINNDSTASLIFSFTDGDGDIGLGEGDTLGVFHRSEKYNNNLFVKYYEMVNGTWVNSIELNYRVQPITPKGKVKVLEGEMEVKLFYDSKSKNDTIKYSVQLVDRALHESNISESNVIIKP